jgi:hypothetical protein
VTQPVPESTDRLKSSLETLFRLMGPRAAYTIQWEGVVLLATPATPSPAFVSALYQGPATFTTPATVNVQLTDPDAVGVFGLGFSAIPIPIWADAGGWVSVPTIGSLVRVGFVNADPSKPYIAGFDPMVLPTLSAGVALRAMAATGLPTPDPAVAAALGLVG